VTVLDLVWSPPGSGRVRTAAFARRSRLEFQAVAATARALAETTSRLIAAGAQVDAFPPVALDEAQWRALCASAVLYGFRGERLDATLAIERADARRLAARAFGEELAGAPESDRLSRLEMRVLDRFLAEICSALEPLCGPVRLEAGLPGTSCEAYVEMRIGAPLGVSLGLGIAREPAPLPGPRLRPEVLEGCKVECSARLGVVTLAAGALVDLCVGDLLPLDTKVAPSATLNVGAHPVAAGEGGILGDRTAFLVRDVTSGASLMKTYE